MLGVAIPTQIQRAGAVLNRTINYANYAWDIVSPLLPRLGNDAESGQISVNGLTIRCDHTVEEGDEFTSAWEDLYRRTPHATPFHSPAWQRAILATPEATRRLRLITARDGQKLVTVLPLQTRGGGVLRTTGTMLSDYLDPLMDPQYASPAWPALLKAVRALEPGRSLILENLRDESLGGTNLDRCATEAGFRPVDASQQAVARIALPKTWDAYLASLDGHQRKELKRKLNKAETQAGAELEICSDPASVLAELSMAFELFQGSGGGKARKAKWLFPRHFGSSAPQLAASGRLVLYKLMIQNQLAAVLISLPTASGQILWNTAFDPALKQWSPGIVLFGMVIRRAIEQGHAVFDLVRGQYEYKYRLGAIDHPLHSVTLRPAF